MKRILQNVLLTLLYLALLYTLLVPGISDLTSTKDVKTVNLAGAVQVLVVEHSINGLIPTGKDYYYLGIENETCSAYLIHASKNWLKENFNEDSTAKDPDGICITALPKKVKKYSVERELNAILSEMGDLEYPFGRNQILEVNYKRTAIIKVILGGLVILLGLFGICMYKKRDRLNIKVLSVYIIVLVITLAFSAIYIR